MSSSIFDWSKVSGRNIAHSRDETRLKCLLFKFDSCLNDYFHEFGWLFCSFSTSDIIIRDVWVLYLWWRAWNKRANREIRIATHARPPRRHAHAYIPGRDVLVFHYTDCVVFCDSKRLDYRSPTPIHGPGHVWKQSGEHNYAIEDTSEVSPRGGDIGLSSSSMGTSQSDFQSFFDAAQMQSHNCGSRQRIISY